MARSEYIYLVADGCVCPRAAFTVKHELVTWLRRTQAREALGVAGLKVYRMRDGDNTSSADPRKHVTELSVRELLGKEVTWHA